VAVVVVKGERRGTNLEAAGALHEARPIRAAAELAVGHDGKTDLLLHPHRVGDALVQNAREFAVVDLLAGVPPNAWRSAAGRKGSPHARRAAGGRLTDAHQALRAARQQKSIEL
jgi:hypothetical protein